MFKFFKKNALESRIMDDATKTCNSILIKGREHDFVYALVIGSAGILNRDLIFFLEKGSKYDDIVKTGSQGEFLKELLAVEISFLLSCFNDLNGFFKSYKMDQIKIQNELIRLFKTNKITIHLKNLISGNKVLLERVSYETKIILKTLKLEEENISIPFIIKKNTNIEVLDLTLSKVIEFFNQLNPSETI